MKKLNLTVAERLICISLLNEFKGSLSSLTDILSDVKKLRITPEEMKKMDMKSIPSNEKIQTVWNAKKAEKIIKELTFENDTYDYLISKIEEKDKKKEMEVSDEGLIKLYEKLK